MAERCVVQGLSDDIITDLAVGEFLMPRGRFTVGCSAAEANSSSVVPSSLPYASKSTCVKIATTSSTSSKSDANSIGVSVVVDWMGTLQMPSVCAVPVSHVVFLSTSMDLSQVHTRGKNFSASGSERMARALSDAMNLATVRLVATMGPATMVLWTKTAIPSLGIPPRSFCFFLEAI